MKRVFASSVALLLAVGASSLFLSAASVIVPSGTWAPTGDLTNARAGAAAVLLSDGVVIITGGYGPDGRSASVERYSVTGGTFIPTAPMHTARTNHTAISLKDGRVLAMGGIGADGVAIDGAEIYDQATNAWTPAGTLVYARAGHTATLLPDGRVLVAGGENGDGALASMEVYSPVFEEFVLVATPMTTARMRHAAALSGEQVLIMGGWDGAAALASVDVYDPATDSVTVGATMLEARAEHTATTLLSGNVLVAAGMNTQGELQTAEIFDAVSGGFVATANAMSAARHNHIAILLPHNNSVLIAGGSSGGAASATAELYRAWQDGGIFVSTGSSLAPRNWSAASALSFAASRTNRSGPADGLVLVAGGEGASSAELYGFATVKTDKDDYQPGDVVYVSGSGWQPNQPVTFYVRELPAEHFARLVTIDADGAGTIRGVKLFDVEEHHLNVRFLLTAADGVSQAHMTFTDTRTINTVTLNGGATVSVAANGSITAAVTATGTGSGQNARWRGTGWRIATTAPGAVTCFDNADHDAGVNTETFTITAPAAAGVYSAYFIAYSDDDCATASGAGVQSATFTMPNAVTVTGAVNTTTTASNATATYGDTSVTLNATVSPASGPSVGVGTVLFTIKSGAIPIGSVTSGTVTAGSASAMFPLSGVNANTYTIEAAYSGGTGFNASSNAAPSPTLTVNKAATTTTVTCGVGPFTYNGAAHTTACTASVIGAGGLNQSLVVSYLNNVNAGTATASASYAESVNHLGNSDSENFTIGKVNATIVVNGSTGNYDGAAHGATGSATGVLSEPLTGLNLGASFTNVPGGTASWTFTDVTGNYNNATGTAAIIINKVNATIVVNGSTSNYDGAAHGATGSATGVLSEPLAGLNLGAGFTNVPGGTASWTFTDVTGNYNNATGTAAIVINKVNATIVVNGSTSNYDGAAHGATGSATGVLSEPLAGLNLGAGFTNVPGGTANWNFTDVTGNYNNATGTAAIVINKVNATIVVNGSTSNYDGAAHGATGSATGVLSEPLAGLNLGASFTNVPGGTANWSFTDATGNYNDASGTAAIVITKADATINVGGYTGAYDGAAHGATGTATGVPSGALTGLNLGASFTNVPGGTASWTFTDVTGNYNDANGSAAIVINKAVANVVVTGYTGIYDSAQHGATGSVTGVDAGGAALGTNLNLGTSFVNAPGGVANWIFTGGTNYNNASGTAAIVLNQATPTVTVSFGLSPVMYDGNSHPATVTVTGVSGPLVIPADGTTAITDYTKNAAPFAGTPTLVGVYTAGASFTSTDGNYTNAVSTTNASLTILTACSTFNGFLSPIGGANTTGGSFDAPVRAFKLNSTIPVKFNATCSGAPLTTGTHTLQATKVSNLTGYEAPIDATPTDAATTGNQFRLTGTEWHFNLSTKVGMSQGIWLLKATLFDGSTYTVWVEIKK